MTTTWHRITRSDWYANGIDSHDEADCSDPTTCTGQVIPPGHDRYDLRDGWMRSEQMRREATPESRAQELADLTAQALSIQAVIRNKVDDARLGGMSWAEIGRALGMTKQGVQQRYGL